MQISSIGFPVENDPLTQQFREHMASPTLKPSPAKIQEIERIDESVDLEKLKKALAEHNITLRFSKDDKTNTLIVEMVDDQTGEEIRQFPTEVSLNLAANFIKMQGQFVDKTK